MNTFKNTLAVSVVTALILISVPTTTQARSVNDFDSITTGAATFRGFKRELSKVRNEARDYCRGKGSTLEIRRCERLFIAESRAKNLNQQPPEKTTIGKQCGQILDPTKWRACIRGQRKEIPVGKLRSFQKRIRSRDVKKQVTECQQKEDPQEKLKCMRKRGNVRNRVKKTSSALQYRRVTSNRFSSPQGLKRSLRRTRDVMRERCGDIRNGNEKRACYKEVREELK